MTRWSVFVEGLDLTYVRLKGTLTRTVRLFRNSIRLEKYDYVKWSSGSGSETHVPMSL